MHIKRTFSCAGSFVAALPHGADPQPGILYMICVAQHRAVKLTLAELVM